MSVAFTSQRQLGARKGREFRKYWRYTSQVQHSTRRLATVAAMPRHTIGRQRKVQMSNSTESSWASAQIESTLALIDWFNRNGLAGFDPYDIYDKPLYKIARKLESVPHLRRIWHELDHFTRTQPARARRLFGQLPHENSKAVGLLLGSWCRLSAVGIQPWPQDGHELVRWLRDNQNTDYPGASWSYPFGYQSRIYFPAGTAWGIVTAICGESLLDFAELTGDADALELGEQAAIFLAEGIKRVETENGAFLTYTPVDDFAIHNASISMGAYLARAGKRFGHEEWTEVAAACLAFTLSEQLPDGAFDYWAKHQSTQRHVDNYHTGFVLRALLDYSRLGFETADEPLAQGWAFYRDTFVSGDGRPLTMEGRLLPINIHGCAESILCGAALADRFDDALPLARRALSWTDEHLRNPDGSYGQGVFNYGVQPFAFTRWGEAWMLRALAELAAAENANRHSGI